MTDCKLENEHNIYTVPQVKLISYMDSIQNHPVFSNAYFTLLEKVKFTPTLYAYHRANFFFRTMATVMGIAYICAQAAANHDQDTLILFAYILNEECGEGDKFRCHELLMEQSHNKFGDVEFGLPPLKVKKSEESKLNDDANSPQLVIQETKNYRDKISELLQRSYPTILGVAFALETHASHMLTHFRSAFALSRSKLNDSEYKHDVEIYFNCHLENGVEDRHAADAKQCIINNCTSIEVLNDIIFGVEETLKIQSKMWDGMYAKAIEVIQKA